MSNANFYHFLQIIINFIVRSEKTLLFIIITIYKVVVCTSKFRNKKT
ncbi:hypothetical protein PROVRETT_06869 [Providencia rettgeri DSM 1131]|nr:hypothetical protein PROVRETT_06869 [Providencia rettgeri DSM 1131]